MKDKLEEWNRTKLDFGEIKKCAIYVRYSINDSKRIEEQKNKLIKFCENVLQTNNYELFVEISSCEDKRKVFNNMLKQFESGEFSHLVVTDFGRIYKPRYDLEKAQEIAYKIQQLNVKIICVDDERCVIAKDKKNDIAR